MLNGRENYGDSNSAYKSEALSYCQIVFGVTDKTVTDFVSLIQMFFYLRMVAKLKKHLYLTLKQWILSARKV